MVERRIELIESDTNIRLIEQPEYKRRWNTEPWESQLERALRGWLLDRLESYFDFDGRMNDDKTATARLPKSLTSVGKLADVARQDNEFLQVGELYRDHDAAFDVAKLLAELVEAESVPHLPIQLARAISEYYVDVQERLGGRDDPRLVPLLASLIELLPWIKQWHNEIDREFGVRMGDYFDGFLQEESRQMGLTLDQIRAWQPPQRSGGRGRRRAKG